MFKLLHIIVVFYICADQIYGLICYICLPEIFTAEECKTVTNGFVDACYHQDVCKTFFFKKKNHQVGIHRSCADRLCSECKFPMFFCIILSLNYQYQLFLPLYLHTRIQLFIRRVDDEANPQETSSMTCVAGIHSSRISW